MTLRAKRLVAAMAALVGSVVILYAASNAILLRSFVQLEQEQIRQHVGRTREALQDAISDLDSQLADWAAWDETYAFVEGEEPEYVKKNLPNATFVDLRLDLLAVFDASGRLIFGRGFDRQRGAAAQFPASLRGHLSPGDQLLRHRDPQSRVAGVLLLPEGPLLVASRPILTSERRGPIRGAMIWGRYLSAVEIRRLAAITHPSLVVRRADDLGIDRELRAAYPSLSDLRLPVVRPLDGSSIAGYALFDDIHGKPALILRIEEPRTIYAQGRASIHYFILWWIAASIVFALVGVSLYERLILSRHERDRSEARYRTLVEEASPVAIVTLDPEGAVQSWNRAAERIFGWSERDVLDRFLPTVPSDREQEARALRHRTLQGERLPEVETLQRRKDGSLFDVSMSLAPLRGPAGTISGIMAVMTDITTRKRAEEQIRRHLRRLTALRAIEAAITSSLDLRVTLTTLLGQAVANMAVHAADILLYNRETQMLEYAAGQGFLTDAFKHTRLRLGEGYAGQAALERRIISVPDLAEKPGDLIRAPLLGQERFRTYYAAPLVTRGEVGGVMELFHREFHTPDAEWMEFLEALAGQAAIAVENAALFENMQRAHADLTMAYDSTLEGWSKALELRDAITEGHTRRVSELTIRLARVLGVPERELIHIRRGVLLHDIGKVAIPDGILRKPGPLTEEEQQIMRRHPVYAYELLAPIAYLRPALDIPYYHHERWDGSGYPCGLKGEQIPLSARIFSVVDVWDALRSDRPYRSAWTDEQVREHIRREAGKQFDPRVVEAFLGLQSYAPGTTKTVAGVASGE